RVLEFKAGRPIEAATVVCRSQHKNNSRTLKTLTNPQGEFVFSDLFPGEYSLYLDELEGYMTGDYSAYKGLGIEEPFSLSSYLIESVSDVILWAKPCWRLSGRVLNLQNEPVEKAQVSLQASADRFTTYGYRGPRHIGSETSTDSNGKYEFKGCFDASEKTNIFVTAKHPHYGFKSSPGVKPRPGDQIEIDLVFEEEPNVMGKVMDAAGKGISGASVYLYAKAGDFVRPGGFQAADVEGCYAMHVPLGSYQGRAQASGYQMPEYAPVKTIHVSGNDVCTLNFKLVENQNLLKGIVVDEDQAPVSRVDVYALPYGKSRRPPLGQWGEKIDQTGEDGIFEVDPAHLDSWDECDWLKLTAVQKSPQEYEPASLYEIRLDSENLTIVLEKKTRDYSFEVYGTVLGSDSRPMQDFEAILFESAVATRTSSQIDKQVYGWTPFHSVNGYFHLKGYDSREGPFLIVARDAKGDKAFSESYHFDPGEVKSGIVIQFQTPYSLSGRIVSDESGEPLEDASIMLQYGVNSVELFQKLQIPGYANMMLSRGGDPRQMRLSGDAPQMAAGKDGRFVIPNLTAPKICLVVMHPGYRVSFHLISRRGEEPFIDMGDITLLNLFAEGSNRDVDVVLH
ncbi:MAG: hypothetical protein ACP5I1_11455, partial [Candidatus Hinthialibacter sp.]